MSSAAVVIGALRVNVFCATDPLAATLVVVVIPILVTILQNIDFSNARITSHGKG